ncbi:uncharacterized protein [Engystomops pustulosus]|uniref:uncharacterized protein n=1 Tax=Engystomops pustulosus TaxID=76066 RepID=UPI003AFAE142
MDKDRKRLAGRILNFTLEIIFLLTGEDYIVVKKITEDGERWKRTQDPITVSESNSYQEILELTSKITELLTGEVPIRCQDFTLYFSMEEWDYIGGHKDLYKDLITENHQILISPDKLIKEEKAERSPSPPPSPPSRAYPRANRTLRRDRQIRREAAAMGPRKAYRRMGINVGALISEVQSHPELWDKGATGYTDRHRRRRAWESICRALYPYWSGFSQSLQAVVESDLRKRWKSVRDRFLKEERNADRSGASPSQRPKVPFHDELMFILPRKGFSQSEDKDQDKESLPEERGPTPVTSIDPEEDLDDHAGPSRVATPPTTAEATTSATAPEVTPPAKRSAPLTRTAFLHGQSRKTLRRTERQLEVESEALSLIRRVDGDDLFDYFGYGIASCCRQMRPTVQQDFISFVYAAAAVFNTVNPLPELGDLINSLWCVSGLRSAAASSRIRVVSTYTQTDPANLSATSNCWFPIL